MCTLIVAKNIFKNFPIVVAANRDEQLDRPSETPLLRGPDMSIYAPKDSARGGTWIGVNKYGMLVAITNRSDVTSVSGKKSRGMLVMRALKYRSTLDAYEDLSCFDGRMFNGFNLVIIDRSNITLLRGDGQAVQSSMEEHGLLVITNHGIGRTITPETPARVRNILELWNGEEVARLEPTPQNLAPLLSIHGDWINATCVDEPDDTYGSKSSSIIRLQNNGVNDEWRYWHRERPNIGTHVCEGKFDTPHVLPVFSKRIP